MPAKNTKSSTTTTITGVKRSRSQASTASGVVSSKVTKRRTKAQIAADAALKASAAAAVAKQKAKAAKQKADAAAAAANEPAAKRQKRSTTKKSKHTKKNAASSTIPIAVMVQREEMDGIVSTSASIRRMCDVAGIKCLHSDTYSALKGFMKRKTLEVLSESFLYSMASTRNNTIILDDVNMALRDLNRPGSYLDNITEVKVMKSYESVLRQHRLDKKKREDATATEQEEEPATKRRYHPGTVQKRKIRYAKKNFVSPTLINEKSRFKKIVKCCLANAMHLQKLMGRDNMKIRLSQKALLAMQMSVEYHMISMLENANKIANHSKRVTVALGDIDLAISIME